MPFEDFAEKLELIKSLLLRFGKMRQCCAAELPLKGAVKNLMTTGTQ